MQCTKEMEKKETQKEQQTNQSWFYQDKLTDQQFRKLSRFIHEGFGIKMPEVKKVMLQCRLQKRLRKLQIPTFKEYIDFVFSEDGKANEVIHLIDVVSTNKTDFYREADHFEYMTEVVLPELSGRVSSRKPLKIWSAGCSSGEEVYTIAFTVNNFRDEHNYFDYQVVGTDISSDILTRANNAVYKEEKTAIIPMSVKRKYLLKSKDRVKPTVKVKPEIRKKTTFFRLNFMDRHYNVPDDFHIIFCRNVLIYFNREVQYMVLQKLCNKLVPGGYLFLGHSESIANMKLPLERIKPTVFKKI